MNIQQRIFTLGASIAFICVVLGAMGAHTLKEVLDVSAKHQYELAVEYGYVHAFGLMISAIAMPIAAHKSRIEKAAWFFLIGVCLFSGSLLLLSITDISWFAIFTPVGGLCFLAGWFLVILSMKK